MDFNSTTKSERAQEKEGRKEAETKDLLLHSFPWIPALRPFNRELTFLLFFLFSSVLSIFFLFIPVRNHLSPKSARTAAMKDVTRPPKKILVLGPCKAGKTAISNYLGEQVDMESLGEYRPTKGVRIVEFESHELEIHQQRVEVDVELWDCSGDERYRDCWPALLDSIEGVILVANPDENKGEDLKLWYQEFIAKSNLDPENVLVVLNEVGEKRTNDGAISEFQLPPQLSSAVCAACNLQHEGDQLRLEFNQFLMTIIAKSEGY